MRGIQLAYFGILDTTAVGGGGGGGPFSGWTNINKYVNVSPYADVVDSNANVTIPNSGTINISTTNNSAYILKTVKNGTTYTGISSLAVAIGDSVHFEAEVPVLPFGNAVDATVTITGIVSDTFTVHLENTNA